MPPFIPRFTHAGDTSNYAPFDLLRYSHRLNSAGSEDFSVDEFDSERVNQNGAFDGF
jgi:hypothetical protein